MKNPIYLYSQKEIDEIDRKHVDLMNKGPEYYNLENFIKNDLPNMDPFNRQVFDHLRKLYFNTMENVIQDKCPDKNQLFLQLVIFMLSNPNLSNKKHNIGESLINGCLERVKKQKKKKNETLEEKPAEQQGQGQPQPEANKKLQVETFKNICNLIITLSRNTMIYFILNFIFVLESSRNEDILVNDEPIQNSNGEVLSYEVEQRFLLNFRTVNIKFKQELFNQMWLEYLMQPFANSI
jgi:hypothetical protein